MYVCNGSNKVLLGVDLPITRLFAFLASSRKKWGRNKAGTSWRARRTGEERGTLLLHMVPHSCCTYVVARKVKALPFRPFFEAIDDPSVRDLRSCLHVLERA